MQRSELKDFLEEKYDLYNRKEFIDSDPVQIPHLFFNPENIEIAGFLSATIAWGQRKTIIKNMHNLIDRMSGDPYQFIMEASENDLKDFLDFKHRTFNGIDCIFFLKALKHFYLKNRSMKNFFEKNYQVKPDLKDVMIGFRNEFFELPHEKRTEKHFANIAESASGKRLNMFLRWMIRKDDRGVDFGLWSVPASALYIPVDVHSGNVARKLGLLKRKQNDWKAVEELTENLRKFDPEDPVKYDFALFGLGVFEKF